MGDKTLTRNDIIDELCKLGLTRRESKDLLEETLSVMAGTLESRVQVKISGLGNFYVSEKTMRSGRNPATGVPAEISARCVVIFHASRTLRRRMRTSRKVLEESA
ncbi:MAG: HU family DNA-binding protein [Gammaproteobacteria bacterium AqS3]|nr:HU family DNA-binding protein [Gammaproteobacteria bacterium AqS3]